MNSDLIIVLLTLLPIVMVSSFVFMRRKAKEEVVTSLDKDELKQTQRTVKVERCMVIKVKKVVMADNSNEFIKPC